MKKNQEITILSKEIMVDITDNRLPLHNILLKASQLSLILDIPDNVNLFNEWAKYAEQNAFLVDNFRINIESAKDPNVSLSSSNPNEHVGGIWGNHIPRNVIERNTLRQKAEQVVGYLAKYRSKTYQFALGVYNKWQFGNIAETIFEKKRKKIEPILEKKFPDINQRLNSIEQNLHSEKDEDWKNAVGSCRTLLMDIADIVNPGDSGKWLNRIKDSISPKIKSKTKAKITDLILEELKNRIEATADYTQGGAHKDRPALSQAEDVVLYTYLAIAEIMQIYDDNYSSVNTEDSVKEKLPETKIKSANNMTKGPNNV